jgi:hypothetical protein
LNCELNKEIYIEAPPGVIEKEGSGKVVHFLWILYGLKQAKRAWWKKHPEELVGMGFIPCNADPSVLQREAAGEEIILPVSTDDMVVAENTQKALNKFKEELRKHFKITDLGPLKWLLNFEVQRDWAACTISLTQRTYIEAMAQKFGQTDTKPIYTPVLPRDVLMKEQTPGVSLETPYQQAVSHVLWPAVVSCPDMQFAVGLLTRFVKNLAQAHWEALKHLIWYAYTTRDLWLTLEGEEIQLQGYVDVD